MDDLDLDAVLYVKAGNSSFTKSLILTPVSDKVLEKFLGMLNVLDNCGFAIIAERMETVRQEGVGKGWAGKWLKVDLSYKVWKVTSSSSIRMVWSGPVRSCGLVWSYQV